MPLWSNTARPKWVQAANGEIHNIFPTNEGWVERHYKGGSAYWDEILARQENILETSAANITAVAFTANQNYATLTVSSGVGNAESYRYATRAFANVFQMSNSTTYNCNAEIISSSNVIPYTQLTITDNTAAIANSIGQVTISNGSANAYSALAFFGNSTVIRVWTANAEGAAVTNSQLFSNLTINTDNAAAFALGEVIYQDVSGNIAVGTVFRANTTQLTVRNVTGAFVANSTQNTVIAASNGDINVTMSATSTGYISTVASASNDAVNAIVSAVSANVTGSLIVKRLGGRMTTSNVIQNGYSNLTISAANNWANGVVSVFYDEQVTVAGGTPSLNIESSDTTNAVCTYASGNNTNKLNFTFTANGASATTFRILGQQIALNGATIKDKANSSVTSNTLFANSVVANVQFGVAGANISV